MQLSTINFYSLEYNRVKTYIIAFAFVVGNIILPQLCHLIPQGGLMLLPIYFFTLIGGYKYGWRVGLLTALFSPLINHLLFGMPSLAVLPAIVTKSILLAFASGIAAHYFKRISIPILALVVFAYQFVGTLAEWIMIGDFFKALQDVRIGIPGILVQIIGGHLFIKYLIRT